METVVLILIGFLVVINVVIGFIVIKGRKGKEESGEGLQLILQQMHELSRTVDTKIGESTKTMHESLHRQLGESTRIVREVTEGLTKLDETNKQVVSFADQLQNLQDILKNPKQRGILGEYYLETVLQNVLPPRSYQMQYGFDNGEIVDAVVFIKDKILPIDSKFSLENYNRILEAVDQTEKERFQKEFKQDLKKRIDETAKYVRPQENTMEFAFMFIPSEGIYYDLLVGSVGTVQSRDLIDYAFSKKVIIVSPTSFLAYLQTVLQGLKGLQIEEQAKEIQKRVGELGRHLGVYEDYMGKLGNALTTTVNHYNRAHKELGKVDKDVMRITGESPGMEAFSVDKPMKEE